jgi:hypothetical protein
VATAPAVADLADLIGRVASSLGLVTSPEIDQILTDLRDLQDSARTVASGFADLAAACDAQHSALCDLRTQLVHAFEDAVKELAEQEAINLAIGVAVSAVTFGVGAAISAARTIELVAKLARPIREMIELWKTDRGISKGVKFQKDLDRAVQRCVELEKRVAREEREALGKPGISPEAPSTLPAGWTDEDTAGLKDYISSDGEKLNTALRDGSYKNDPVMSQRLDRIDNALQKLPDYKGTVDRMVDSRRMPPEVLAKYQKGAKVTEDAFTSSSAPGAGNWGAKGASPFDGDVEFLIKSKTGKDVSGFADREAIQQMEKEVLFNRGTTFDVTDRYIDPATHRTIIEMSEH